MGPVVLLVYAILMLVGGFVGFRSGSNASLMAGSLSGVSLLAAWAVSGNNLTLGLWIGIGVSALLCVVFVLRTVTTGRWVPSGVLLTLSLVALVLLGVSIARV